MPCVLLLLVVVSVFWVWGGSGGGGNRGVKGATGIVGMCGCHLGPHLASLVFCQHKALPHTCQLEQVHEVLKYMERAG
jgi:hypothetical protein